MNFQYAIQNSANPAMFSNISEKKSKSWDNLRVSHQSGPPTPTLTNPALLFYIPALILLQRLLFSHNSSVTLGKMSASRLSWYHSFCSDSSFSRQFCFYSSSLWCPCLNTAEVSILLHHSELLSWLWFLFIQLTGMLAGCWVSLEELCLTKRSCLSQGFKSYLRDGV